MSDIFREVDEALQKEKASQFWKDYGPTLVLAVIIMIAATGLTSAYLGWKTWRNHTETAKLVSASENADVAAAMENAAKNTSGGHETVALMIAANQYAAKKEFSKAAEIYTNVAADSGAPDALQDLAVVLNARTALLIKAEAAPDYKALSAPLEKLAKDETSAFRFHAMLEAALLYGDGLKDYTKALDLLKGFEDERAPDSLREKAAALEGVYAYEASQNGKQ